MCSTASDTFSSLLSIVRTNSSTSIRLGDGLGYISVWAAPPNRLNFWDGVPSLISGIRVMPQTRCVKNLSNELGPMLCGDKGVPRWVGWPGLPPLLR